MAKIETWFTCDLHGPVQVHTLDNDLFNQDSLGNLIGVKVYSDGEPVTLSGSVNGYIVRSDGVTVPVAGTRSGNQAYITMPSSAYSVVGVVQIVIKLTEGSSITTLAACVGYMHESRTGSQVDPGSTITDWTNQIAAELQAVEDAKNNMAMLIAVPYENITFPVIVGAYTIYNGNLYTCKVPIGTSEAFTSSKWTKVKVSDELYAIKKRLENSGSALFVPNKNTTRTTDYGITFEWADGHCHVYGTATGGIFDNFIDIKNAFPEGMKAGGTYWLDFVGVNVKVQLYKYVEGVISTRFLDAYNKTQFTVPSDASGILARLYVSNNSVVNETVTPVIRSIDNITNYIADELKLNSIYNYGGVGASGYSSCNDIDKNSIYFVSAAGGVTNVTDYAYDAPGWLVTCILGNYLFQMALPYNTTLYKIKYRSKRGSSNPWSDWVNDTDFFDNIKDIISYPFFYVTNGTDRTIDGITFEWNGKSCHVYGTSGTGVPYCNFFDHNNSFPEGAVAGGTYWLDYKSENVYVQMYKYVNGSLVSPRFLNAKQPREFTVPSDASGLLIRLYAENNTTVNEIVTPVIRNVDHCVDQFILNVEDNLKLNSLYNYGGVGASGYSSCNDIDKNSIYFVSAAGGVTNVTDYAYAAPGFLITYTLDNIIFQMALPYNTNLYSPQYRSKRGSSNPWSDWKEWGGGTVYNYTEVERDTYNNEYNITTSPVITTDSNGWLQPVDVETENETGKIDMTGAIMSMLTSTGYCHLAPGIFYISGNIDMPEGSTLEGCGNKTIIRLLSSVQSGYCVKTSKYNTIRGISFSGGYSDISVSSPNIGGRNGIQLTGTATRRSCITDCFFSRFNGSAIYQYNTGGSVYSYLTINDCHITNCAVGINIDYYSEYCKYSNTIIHRCHYGCINNGGNNVFIGCTFHGVVGFVIDNTSGTKSNNAHGSVVGCTFNHIDNWDGGSGGSGNGDAIVIKSVNNGFIFTGCQIWYGNIVIENGRGIALSDCLIGGGTPQITISGSKPAFFSNCIFHSMPSISVGNTGTKFDNCYYSDTGAIITA